MKVVDSHEQISQILITVEHINPKKSKDSDVDLETIDPVEFYDFLGKNINTFA